MVVALLWAIYIYIKSLACLYVCMYVCMYACLDFELKRPDQYDGKLKAES